MREPCRQRFTRRCPSSPPANHQPTTSQPPADNQPTKANQCQPMPTNAKQPGRSDRPTGSSEQNHDGGFKPTANRRATNATRSLPRPKPTARPFTLAQKRQG
ncbi:hypothetical protein ACQY0O_005424 [Thecaphora frezii]